MREDVLERIYQESLEERIIAYLAELRFISLEEAMRVYYESRLAEMIHDGEYGVQYLDYKELAEMLAESA